MFKPQISIITICYNAENEIERTMLSVLRQTYDNFEYIIVDGKSKDCTMKIINTIVEKYPNRVIKVISEPDNGIYDAMNKGIKQSSGEWLSMMNAGDVFADINVLEKVFTNKIPEEKSFIYSDIYQSIYNGDNFLRRMNIDENELKIIHQCVIYRKNLHNEHGYYVVTKQIIISDYLFFLRIPIEQTMKVDVVIAIYAAHGVSDQGTWCSRQLHCADVVFRRRNFWGMVLHYIAYRVKVVCIPRRLREWLLMHKNIFK